MVEVFSGEELLGGGCGAALWSGEDGSEEEEEETAL